MDLLGSLAIESVFPILYAYQIRRKLTVVSNFLVSKHNNRIALGGVDSNRVYCDRLGLNSIGSITVILWPSIENVKLNVFSVLRTDSM